MVFRAILGQAATITLLVAPLHLPLVIFELYAVLEYLLAHRHVVIRMGSLGAAALSIRTLSCVVAAHLLLLLCLLLLLLLLLLALELLLLLNEVGARVLV